MDSLLLIAIATMGGLGFVFAGALAAADKKLRVEEDPKIAKVNDATPGANCGGCGYAGCYDFAVNVVEGNAKPDGCPPGGSETAQAIGEIMGIEVGESVKMRPVVMCQGGDEEAAKKNAEYFGPASCSVRVLVSGGDKLCNYGCVGGADCVEACPFDALFMNDNGIPELIPDRCTGCAICEEVCPRDVIEMHPADRNIFVFCKNQDDPKTARKVCTAACIGCGICARKSDGGVVMEDNLAIINYEKIDPDKIPFDKCPTRAIVQQLDKKIGEEVETGTEATKVAAEPK